MSVITIQPIDYNDVINEDKNRFNSNNHWIDDKRPDDYLQVLEKGNTKYWINNFKTYKKIDIPEKYLGWLKAAADLGMTTGKPSKLYEDELEDMVDEMMRDPSIQAIFDGTEYFVRSENVSLKCGVHGAGPYTSLRSIIESSITCVGGHSPVYMGTKQLSFYLIDWVPMHDDFEFRMFVYNQKVTCISQQKLYRVNHSFKALSEEEIRDMVKILLDYFESNIKMNITNQDSYSIDISLIGEDHKTPYFIEVNCFGSEYAAGSALFHWILDHDLLYAEDGSVTFRYTY